MKALLILSLIFLAAIAAAAQTASYVPLKPDSSYDVQDNVIIKARGGAPISAIVVRGKENAQPLAGVLFYTAYVGNNDVLIGKKIVDKGYVAIIAYARGMRTNLDNFMPYEHEAADIYDIIDWASKQSWCDGQVAMYGGSYTGFSQWSTVKHPHPALKTIVPQAAVMPGYDTPMEHNVCISALCLNWANAILNYQPLDQNLFPRWFAAGGSYRALDSFAGRPNRIFQKWLQHPSYDAYWKAMVPTPDEYRRLKIPVLTTTGYYDDAQLGAITYLREHYKQNPHAEHYLIIGPYSHRGAQRNAPATLNGYQIDPAAYFNMEDIVFQWLDYVLKGKSKPALLQDRINYEVMGANEWRHSSSLETMSDRTLTFYLRKGQTDSNNVLSPDKPKQLDFVNQVVDFADRNNQNNYFTPVIINDPLNPGNGIVFMSAPFTETRSISGSFAGRINTAINKRDLDISIALYEMTPEGKYFFLTRYLGRASFAKDQSRRQLLRPGKKETIPITDTRVISKQIAKGGRLVIVLNVNKHPFEVVNYGTGKNVYDETISDAKSPLRVKWYNDSYITIPISK